MTQTQTAPAKPAEASPAKPLFGFRALLADLAGWIRRHLLTVCLVLFVILINVGTQIVCALIRQPFPPSLAKVSFEALARGRWYTAPISMLYVPNLGRLLIDVPLMLVAFGLAESVIGKIKTAWVSVITTLGGVALGMGLCSLSDGRSPQWHAISHDGAILGPLILVAGTLMCASAFTTMLWRRRIRVIGYAVVLIMFLYRGEVSDYCLLATSVIGHVLGYLMASCTHGDEYRHGAIYEMRRLIGIVAGVQAIGSLVAVSSRQSFGLLSMFGLLTGSTDFDTGRVVDCLSGASHTDCFTQYRMMRLTMPGNWLVSIMPTLMLLLIAWGLYRGRHLAATLSIVFNACTIALSTVFYVAIPLSYVDGPDAGAYMDAISALQRHGAFHAMLATMALPLLCIVIIILFRACFTIRTKSETVLRGIAITFAAFVLLGLLYVGYGLSMPSGFNETPLLVDLIADYVQRLLPIGLLSGVEPAFVPVGLLSEIVYQCVGPMFWLVALCCTWDGLRDRSMINDAYRHRVDDSGLHFSLKDAASMNMAEDGKILINGAMGITGIKKTSTFTIGIILVLITLVVVLNLIRSRAGRAISAIRDNEIAAKSIGINITRYKLMAFVLSSVFAGMAGVLYSLNYSSLVAKKFDYNTSINILVFVVLGGIGSIRGSVIAAAILTVLPEMLRGLNDYRMLIYAIVLIVMMIFTRSPKLVAWRKEEIPDFEAEQIPKG